MNEILTAAFLVLLGSQQPCARACVGPDCAMPTFGYVDNMGTPGYGLAIRMPGDPDAVPVNIAAFKDRASLDKAAAETWFGPRCDPDNSNVTAPEYNPGYEAHVLDVRAGRWFVIKQTKVVAETVERVRRRTGKLKVVVR